MGGFYATAKTAQIEFKGWFGFRLGMDEVSVLEIATICLIFCLIVERFFSRRNTSDRFDDIVEGLGVFANEMISRTEKLTEMANQMPEISLHNHNPIESILNAIMKMRGVNLQNENITSPRGLDGRYAATPEDSETPPQWEEIDVID